jgi:hypothetical protein
VAVAAVSGIVAAIAVVAVAVVAKVADVAGLSLSGVRGTFRGVVARADPSNRGHDER